MRVVERAMQIAQPVGDIVHAAHASSPAGMAETRRGVLRGTERLTHPLEILLDSPRVLDALGGAVPLVALGIWYCVGDLHDQD